jgi:hypothetical protein
MAPCDRLLLRAFERAALDVAEDIRDYGKEDSHASLAEFLTSAPAHEQYIGSLSDQHYRAALRTAFGK